jgi:hypothetical protein
VSVQEDDHGQSIHKFLFDFITFFRQLYITLAKTKLFVFLDSYEFAKQFIHFSVHFALLNKVNPAILFVFVSHRLELFFAECQVVSENTSQWEFLSFQITIGSCFQHLFGFGFGLLSFILFSFLSLHVSFGLPLVSGRLFIDH